MRFELLDSEPLIKEFFNHEEKVKSDEEANKVREEEIARREQAFQLTLSKKLTVDDISTIPDKSDRDLESFNT